MRFLFVSFLFQFISTWDYIKYVAAKCENGQQLNDLSYNVEFIKVLLKRTDAVRLIFFNKRVTVILPIKNCHLNSVCKMEKKVNDVFIWNTWCMDNLNTHFKQKKIGKFITRIKNNVNNKKNQRQRFWHFNLIKQHRSPKHISGQKNHYTPKTMVNNHDIIVRAHVDDVVFLLLQICVGIVVFLIYFIRCCVSHFMSIIMCPITLLFCACDEFNTNISNAQLIGGKETAK